MIRILIYALIAYLIYRLVKGVFTPKKEIQSTRSSGVIDEMVQDPFCKTYVPRRESVKRVIGGQEHFFCSKECADKFHSEREK